LRRVEKCSFAVALARRRRQRPQELQHFDIVRIWCDGVLGLDRVPVRRLENQWYTGGTRIGQQPSERFAPDLALADERVTIPVRCERILAVVQVKERRRLGAGVLERVQYRALRLARRGDVVTSRKQMTGVEAIAGALAQRSGDRAKDGANFVRRTSHGDARTGRIFDQ